MVNTVIIQPPLVQLNAPYPSGAYLLNFFNTIYKEKSLIGKVNWFDFSNDFFHSIFCRSGISKIFSESSTKALSLAQKYETQGDDNTAFMLRRFVSQSEQWTSWIDRIIAIVCFELKKSNDKKISGREFSHEFVRGAHVPRGARMENYLQSLERDVTTDDAQILASLALADLSDYITLVYDNNFSLIRYAEHLATSTSDFTDVENALNSACLKFFLQPIILENLESYKNEKTVFCISIPFPGCFESALFIAKIIKDTCKENAIVFFGGGYINTELREITEKKIFNYCDAICYDKGYASYVDFFEKIKLNEQEKFSFILNGEQFYNISYLYNDKIILPLTKENSKFEQFKKIEHEYVKKITPDYSKIVFSKYPRLADDTNPMHRIWNDGAWLKAYIAHGCYWAKCAFCDTTLDYVKDYCPTNVDNLFCNLYEQAQKTGVYGIHFVDEACPPRLLQNFALKNLCVKKSDVAKIPLTFWGNIRFEKTFTRDLADLLCAGGLTAVSAGIEIATGCGLENVNKGTDMENIISACCAFKEAGILIHSYMIFGFWNQSAQDLIDSMETLRQMFEAGLLDSAFWHKFTLTLHSTVYKDVQNGMYPDLKIFSQKKSQFAKNDLHFEGEEKSEKYSIPLNLALESWMHRKKLNQNVESFFPFKMPSPSIKRDYVFSLIQKYEQKKENEFSTLPITDEQKKSKYVWLGGVPLILDSSSGQVQLCWNYMGELLYADCKKIDAKKIVDVLNSINVRNYDATIESEKEKFYAQNILEVLGKKIFLELRGKGLCKLL